MNRYLKQELWFRIKFLLAYLGLGLVSALFAIALSYPFSGWVRTAIKALVFLAGFYIIEIRVEKTPHEERAS